MLHFELSLHDAGSAQGGTIRTLSAAERQAWVEVMKPVWDQFTDDVGQDMIDAAQALN